MLFGLLVGFDEGFKEELDDGLDLGSRNGLDES